MNKADITMKKRHVPFAQPDVRSPASLNGNGCCLAQT
jgi:hypothetical protein